MRVLILALTLALAGCTEDVIDSVLWDLDVVNQTTDNLDLYEDIEVDTEGFGLVGQVNASSTFVLRGRVDGARYHFRLVRRGEPSDSVLFERTIDGDGRDQIWIVP